MNVTRRGVRLDHESCVRGIARDNDSALERMAKSNDVVIVRLSRKLGAAEQKILVLSTALADTQADNDRLRTELDLLMTGTGSVQ